MITRHNEKMQLIKGVLNSNTSMSMSNVDINAKWGYCWKCVITYVKGSFELALMSKQGLVLSIMRKDYQVDAFPRSCSKGLVMNPR